MQPCSNFSPCSLFLLGLACLAVAGCAPLEPTPPEPTRPPQALRPPQEFKPVSGTEGAMWEATLFVEKLPALGARLEIRTITVRSQGRVVLPIAGEAALEVRSGEVEVITDDGQHKRGPGDMWVVARGSRLTLNVLGQSAALRAIYLIREGN